MADNVLELPGGYCKKHNIAKATLVRQLVIKYLDLPIPTKEKTQSEGDF